MKKRALQRAVERYVAARFPELQPRGHLLVTVDRFLLRGFSFDRSQRDKTAFRLRVFAQVLSVPEDTVAYSFFRDLGDFFVDPAAEEEAFTAAADQAEGHGREFLARVADCRALLENLPWVVTMTSYDHLVREACCHCLIVSGDDTTAVRELESLHEGLPLPETQFEEEFRQRVAILHTTLQTSPSEAIKLLDIWASETATALGVADLRPVDDDAAY